MPDSTTSGAAPAGVLLIGADADTRALLGEWLGADGWRVDHELPQAGSPPALALVDVPYARDGCADQARRLAAAYPGTPLLALSPTFFGSVLCDGDCARKLGVAGVLPKPVARAALLAAVRRFART